MIWLFWFYELAGFFVSDQFILITRCPPINGLYSIPPNNESGCFSYQHICRSLSFCFLTYDFFAKWYTFRLNWAQEWFQNEQYVEWEMPIYTKIIQVLITKILFDNDVLSSLSVKFSSSNFYKNMIFCGITALKSEKTTLLLFDTYSYIFDKFFSVARPQRWWVWLQLTTFILTNSLTTTL